LSPTPAAASSSLGLQGTVSWWSMHISRPGIATSPQPGSTHSSSTTRPGIPLGPCLTGTRPFYPGSRAEMISIPISDALCHPFSVNSVP